MISIGIHEFGDDFGMGIPFIAFHLQYQYQIKPFTSFFQSG